MNASWITWGDPCPAPAKLNLFLHVLGRRPDGYHTLQTVFRFLEYGDVLRFYPRTDTHIHRVNPLAGVSPDEDLCVRAARLLQPYARRNAGVDIVLEKNLPMGGGLGGGSSDAATVLRVLNHLWDCRLSRPTLQQLGLSLGADVPVFVFGQNAFAEGVGETLRPVSLLPNTYLVLEPPVTVPTPQIFRDPNLCRNTPPIDPLDWQEGLGHNDLEPVACALFPEICAHLDWLNSFAPARMTGSGACVFASFPNRETAATVQAQAPSGIRSWIAEGLAIHPLESRLPAPPSDT